MSIEITLRQAKELVEFFGGHDCEVTVIGHEKGLLAYCTEYPEEGGQYLGDTDVDDDLAISGEVARANLDKIGPDGTVLKDENGKVKKPAGWRGPDIAPYVLSDTVSPATANFPHDDMGAYAL